MRDLAVAAVVIGAYVAVLVATAAWAERREARRRSVVSNPLVYSLALGVYATTWTYYGSVGFAARTGLLFLTVYLGPTLCAALWWWVLRKLVRIKNVHRYTGLADLLSLRYEKSQAIAVLATVMLVAGLVPYIALQMKTLITTLGIVAGEGPMLRYPESGRRVGPVLVGLLLLFTIAFGLRRARPTERHPGLVAALAVESIVKLAGFLAAGAFVTWGLFGGVGDLFARAMEAAPPVAPPLLGGHGVVTWLTHLLISGVAILLLPRQFHVAVVENSDEDHVRHAMWLFPVYLVAINLFVLPMALAGVVYGYPLADADTFVLRMPLDSGQTALSWLVFLGGFSAGTGMVIVETTALATMISNHLAVPAAQAWRPLASLRAHVVAVRRIAALLVLVAALGYERAFGSHFDLVSIGFVSFVAVLQLAPAVLGGLFWRRASRAGAMAGLAIGFATWIYTLVVPVLVRSGWLPMSLIITGPFGLEALQPEGLFDIHVDPVSHAVIWSLILNGGAFVAGSILFPPRREETARVERLLDVLAVPEPARLADGAPAIVAASQKRDLAAALLATYYDPAAAANLADGCVAAVGGEPGGALSALQLAELQAQVETAIAATVGSAAAHAALKQNPLVTPEESRAISRSYGELLAALNVSPAELQRRLDYHRERERLLEEAVRARDEFLAVASHELKTPLTPLRIKIQTLERLVKRGALHTVPQDQLARLFGGADEQVIRLVALVDELLDVTRLRRRRMELHREDVDLAAVAREVVERHVAEAADAGCAVRVDATGSVGGSWDRMRVEQIATNLLINAFKYAPRRPVEVLVEGDAAAARLVVRDEGPGIPPEEQDRIFEPFQRGAVTAAQGFGLGLFIVRQIAEAHGGTVRLESVLGQGSAFIVELPRTAPTTSPVVVPAAS